MKCYSCDKQKSELHSKDSELLKGITLVLCSSCIQSNYEPRWTVVLAGRTYGSDFIKDYIVRRRYIGKTISAEELLSQ